MIPTGVWSEGSDGDGSSVGSTRSEALLLAGRGQCHTRWHRHGGEEASSCVRENTLTMVKMIHFQELICKK